jgi:molybdopterin synthase sulfur carrier subunit
MAVLRLFAAAREAAATGRAELPGTTVSEILDQARARFGDDFAQVLATSRIWVNGESVDGDCPVTGTDEVAVLPPVSGGAG